MELWVGGRENANSTSTETGQYATGFGLYKFYKEGKGSLANNYLEWPYLRMSEMYLIYAEALLKNNQPKLAIEMVDKVRARVGLKGLIESNQDKNLLSDSNALMEEILRERACELGLEDVRFFDMIRNKRADLLSVLYMVCLLNVLMVEVVHGLINRKINGDLFRQNLNILSSKYLIQLVHGGQISIQNGICLHFL